MRVGVYVDGYNLYYGGRRHFGRGTSGWKWLSPRALAETLVEERAIWPGAHVERVVYCTAHADANDSPGAARDQDVYLKALTSAGAVDHVEFGRYVGNAKEVPLAWPTTKGRPRLVRPAATLATGELPLRVTRSSDTGQEMVLATALIREEKGSDVNVATHLLVDVLTGVVDAAVVISNDSDLALPLRVARSRVPVGAVNPSPNQLAGALRGRTADGVGLHWWFKLTEKDFRAHQMPNPTGRYTRPVGW